MLRATKAPHGSASGEALSSARQLARAIAQRTPSFMGGDSTPPPPRCQCLPLQPLPRGRKPAFGRGAATSSVAVLLGLVGALDRHVQVLGLLGAQLVELHVQLAEVQARDLLV